MLYLCRTLDILQTELCYLLWCVCFQMSAEMATDHVNGNGTEEPMDTTAAVAHSESYQALLEAGLPQAVAEKLDELYIAGQSSSVFSCVCRFR